VLFEAQGWKALKKEELLARDNYSFKKYKKEQARKKKQEAKRQRRLEKKSVQPESVQAQVQ